MVFEGDNMMGVKRTNRSAAIRILHEQGSISRKHLAECIKLTPAAITKIVGELIEENIISEGKTVPNGGAGRREVMVELNSRAKCALGVLINLRVAMLSAVWLDGTVIFSEEVKLPDFADADGTVEQLSARLAELVKKTGLKKEQILGLGLAIRGITLNDQRIVVDSYGAINKKNYPIAARFEETTGYKVVMANNVRALFSAQMFLAKDTSVNSQFFLRCEYGIGGALSVNGKIWYGGSERCSEIGHVPVIRRGGKPCHCGKSGCLETIASPMAILDDARAILSKEKTPVLWLMAEKNGGEISLEDVLESAHNGDAGTSEILDRAVNQLATALKNVIYVIDPAKIVLYGRVFENSYYLMRLLSELSEGVDSGHNITIEKSRYNQQLEEKAAGLLMVEYYFEQGGML